jgi:hypothetical protein
VLCVNEFTSFLLGTHPFTSVAAPLARDAAATARHQPPTRPPDAVVEAPTTASQAALYRLNGDYNPLHIDPAVAQGAGFQRPILHGLCSMGMAVRAVVAAFAGDDPSAVLSVKVRPRSRRRSPARAPPRPRAPQPTMQTGSLVAPPACHR